MSAEREGARWGPVAAYAALAAATQIMWLTYAPLTTASAHHYHVSETAIGWLAELFPLAYVVLALPAGRLLDRAFHRWLAVGAVLTALGGLARLVEPTYAWALLGQLLVAIGQPLVLNAVTKVASEHLPPHLRPHGIAVGSAAIFVGMLLALVLGTVFGGAHLAALLVVQAVFGVLAAASALRMLELRRRAGGGCRRDAVGRGRPGRAARGLGGPHRARARGPVVPRLRRVHRPDDVVAGAPSQLPRLLEHRRHAARRDGARRRGWGRGAAADSSSTAARRGGGWSGPPCS